MREHVNEGGVCADVMGKSVPPNIGTPVPNKLGFLAHSFQISYGMFCIL